MSITDITDQQASPLAREVLFTRIRGELRIVHPRLTDRQLDQIADAIVEIRLTSARLDLVRESRRNLPAVVRRQGGTP